jgi:hypothetical protein
MCKLIGVVEPMGRREGCIGCTGGTVGLGGDGNRSEVDGLWRPSNAWLCGGFGRWWVCGTRANIELSSLGHPVKSRRGFS